MEERANGNKEMTVVLSYVKQLAASALQKQMVLLINLLRKGLTQVINGDGGSICWAPDTKAIICICIGIVGVSITSIVSIVSNVRMVWHCK